MIGTVNAVKGMCQGVAPLIFGRLVHARAHKQYPGSPYLLSAFLGLLAFIVTLQLAKNHDDYHPKKVIEINDDSSDALLCEKTPLLKTGTVEEMGGLYTHLDSTTKASLEA